MHGGILSATGCPIVAGPEHGQRPKRAHAPARAGTAALRAALRRARVQTARAETARAETGRAETAQLESYRLRPVWNAANASVSDDSDTDRLTARAPCPTSDSRRSRMG